MSIVAADVNGDGHIDIIIGNGGRDDGRTVIMDANGVQENQIVNSNRIGNSEPFQDVLVVTVPSSDVPTLVIAAAGANGDGHIDVITGNDLQEDQIVMNNGKGNSDPFLDAVPMPSSWS